MLIISLTAYQCDVLQSCLSSSEQGWRNICCSVGLKDPTPHNDGWVYLGTLSLVCVYWQNTKNEGKWHLSGLTASWELLLPFSSARLALSKEQRGVMQNCYKHVTFWLPQSSIHPVCYLYLLQEFFKSERGSAFHVLFTTFSREELKQGCCTLQSHEYLAFQDELPVSLHQNMQKNASTAELTGREPDWEISNYFARKAHPFPWIWTTSPCI